jgi:hypothetical protein
MTGFCPLPPYFCLLPYMVIAIATFDGAKASQEAPQNQFYAIVSVLSFLTRAINRRFINLQQERRNAYYS